MQRDQSVGPVHVPDVDRGRCQQLAHHRSVGRRNHDRGIDFLTAAALCRLRQPKRQWLRPVIVYAVERQQPHPQRPGPAAVRPDRDLLSAQAFQSCAWIRAAIEEPEGLIKQGAERPELRRLLFTGQAALREGGRDPRTRVMHAREGVDSSGGGQQAQHDPGTRQDRSVALAEHIVRATGRPRAHDYDSGRQWPKQCAQSGRSRSGSAQRR